MKIKKFIYNHIVPLIGRLFSRPTKIPIIYYHNIVEDGQGYSFMHTNLSIFEKHMKYLATNKYKTYKFDGLPKKFAKKLNSKEIIIAFDDGFLSNYTIVFPLMKKLGLKFNIFLTVENIEEKKENYINWDIVNEMYKSKIVGFGAHTYTHIDARNITDSNYDREITETNSLIKKYTNNNVNDFCFPYGYYNDEIIEKLCRDRIYKRIYTSDKIKLKIINNCEVVGRTGISTEYDVDMFKKNVKGFYNIMYYYRIIISTRTLFRKIFKMA